MLRRLLSTAAGGGGGSGKTAAATASAAATAAKRTRVPLSRWRKGLLAAGAAVVAASAAGAVSHHRYHAERDDWCIAGLQGGSLEANISDTLRTGDILLFDKRVFAAHTPWQFLLNALYKATARDEYNHVAVVVRDRRHNIPYVLEHTFAGVSLRPFDQRLLHTTSNEILLRRYVGRVDDAVLDRVDTFVQAVVDADAKQCAPCRQVENLTSFARLVLDRNEPTRMGRIDLLADHEIVEASSSVLRRNINALLSTVTPRDDGSYPALATVLLTRAVAHLTQLSAERQSLEHALDARSAQLTAATHARYTTRATFPSAELCARVLQIMNMLPPEPHDPSTGVVDDPVAISAEHMHFAKQQQRAAAAAAAAAAGSGTAATAVAPLQRPVTAPARCTPHMPCHAVGYEYTAYDFVSEQTRRWRRDKFAPPPARDSGQRRTQQPPQTQQQTVTIPAGSTTTADGALDADYIRRLTDKGFRVKVSGSGGAVTFDSDTDMHALPAAAAAAAKASSGSAAGGDDDSDTRAMYDRPFASSSSTAASTASSNAAAAAPAASAATATTKEAADDDILPAAGAPSCVSRVSAKPRALSEWTSDDVLGDSVQGVEARRGLVDVLRRTHLPETVVYTVKTPLKKPMLLFQQS